MKQNRQLPTTCLEAKGGANLFIDLSNISNLFKDRLNNRLNRITDKRQWHVNDVRELRLGKRRVRTFRELLTNSNYHVQLCAFVDSLNLQPQREHRISMTLGRSTLCWLILLRSRESTTMQRQQA